MLTAKDFNRRLRTNAIIKGLILGVILLAGSIFSYYLITSLTQKPWLIVFGPYFFAILLPLFVTIGFCMDMRRRLGGYWSLRQAITAIFIMFITCYILLSIGRDLIFAKTIEPDMQAKTQLAMVSVRTQALKAGGASQTEINNQVAELKKGFTMDNSADAGSIIQNYVINFLMLFVVAIIFGAVFKKPSSYELVIEKDTMAS
jgi:hypothetical protein